jgi:hypothetical protein
LDALVEPLTETDKVPDFVKIGDTVPIIFIEGFAEFVELAD